jgi:hypothetical protein
MLNFFATSMVLGRRWHLTLLSMVVLWCPFGAPLVVDTLIDAYACQLFELVALIGEDAFSSAIFTILY